MMKFLCLNVMIMISQLITAQGLLHELQLLYQVDRLPQYIENSYVEQFSSYDRTGKNDDGFSGTYSFIRKEGDDLVIAEMKGPGVINRVRWAPPATHDTIQFFFDGEQTPRINMPFIDMYTSNRFPFLSPVCGYELGGYYCYLPIPYKKSCKVVFKGKMHFYHLQYRTYPENTEITSFSLDWDEQEKEALRNVVRIWNNYGTNYLEDIYENIKTNEANININPGETKRIFEMTHGGRIIGIEMTGISKLDKNNNCLVLRAKWDNENEWAINVPVKDFFGYYFGEKSMRSILSGTSGSTSYTYYPMPFDHYGMVELEYLKTEESSGKEIGIKFFYTERSRERNEGKFYAYWKREIEPPEGEPYEIMPMISGKGHYAGTILNCQGLIPGSTGFFEGDEQVTSDGKLRMHGTGSEEYFNGGWYAIPDRWDMAQSLPTHGCLGYDLPLSRTGGYRHFISDKLSFQKDFKLTIEHGPVGNKFPVDYSSVSFYYAEKALQQKTPTAGLSAYPQPEIIKFHGIYLPAQAVTNGKIVVGQSVDQKRVMILESLNDEPMLAKFNLEVPVDGVYKMYCSYFMTPSSGEIRFMQRQNELSDWKNLNRPEETYVESEYFGNLNIADGSGSVTIHLKGREHSKFILHYFLLIKL